MEHRFLGQQETRIHYREPCTQRTKTNCPLKINIRTMNHRLNPNAAPFIPKNNPSSHTTTPDWPPISKPDDPEEQETLEGIERLSKWISELETSTKSRCQNKKLLETPVLRKSFPLTETLQSKTKLDGKVKQLYNSAEEARTRCLQLETTISNLQAAIKYQCSLLKKTNIIDGRNNEPFLWQIPAFSTLYRKAKTFPNEPLSNFKCSFTSPIYTTHLTGCKISLRLFPYGINLFRGTHSSICCELHFSDFTLPRTWPFERQLEISIIDQKDKNNKWSTYFPNNSDKNNQDDTHAGTYTLPELMREDFIPHTKLLVNFREAFLNNDSVILQIKFNEAPFKIPSAKESPLHF